MALPRSGKNADNVTRLDAERRKRSTAVSGRKRKTTAGRPSAATSSTLAGNGEDNGALPAGAKGRSSDEQPGRPARNDAKGKANAKTRRGKPCEAADRETQSKRQSGGTGKSERRVGNRRFDTEKVERIKAAIARGEYRIDYLQVADKFIEHERYA